ncbi:hypothetical protein [Algoriphagus litoralis]|uniref:hypothetical protein n=1 Tax=Algoriphagus litoralis TaxID=2202829 RepID=UPI000DBA741F|nr:hypothetical protein [Algoriphagus litoralis]
MGKFELSLEKLGLMTVSLINLAFSGISQHHEGISQDFSSNEKLFGDQLKTGSFGFHLRSFYRHTENQPGHIPCLENKLME